jgi:hypothetical protein
MAYKTHSPPLKIMMTREFVKKLTTTTTINPYLSAPGAQVIILGHNHLSKIGWNISCLHRTAAVLDCANASATRAMGVLYGCIRGKSALMGNTLVHRGIVHVIEGDIFLLSQTALKDLGVIPTTFPRIGEFGGIGQQGDAQDRFEVDGPYNIRYIEAEQVPIGYDQNRNLKAITKNLPRIRFLVSVLGLIKCQIPGRYFGYWFHDFRYYWLNQEDNASFLGKDQ